MKKFKENKLRNSLFLRQVVVLCCFLPFFAMAQSGISDCSGAIEVCGNGAISSNAIGVGVQELENSNSCSSQENNSLWIKIEITKPGTLGFQLTPLSPDIVIDYDFFVFGPNASCEDLGFALRCSTTNPKAAGLLNNVTGMNDTEIDEAEGPGSHGNGFVRSLDVLPGEMYYIVIDRPIGESPFDLIWTGTATTEGSPFAEGVDINPPRDLVQCGINGRAEFDLSQIPVTISDQPQTRVELYSMLSNAIDQNDPIGDTYVSTRPRKTIYARVDNLVNECHEIASFDLVIPQGPDVPEVVELSLCDVDSNGSELFKEEDIAPFVLGELDPVAHKISYHSSDSDAVNGMRAISTPIATPGETIYARVEEVGDLGCFSISVVNLQLNHPVAYDRSDISGQNFRVFSGGFVFNLPNGEEYKYTVDDLSEPFQSESVFRNLTAGTHRLYFRHKDQCEVGSATIIVPIYAPYFTPNNDWYNDLWKMDLGDYNNSGEPVKIFDRYGKFLAEFLPNTRGWDGKFKGRDLPADDYWFRFLLPSNQEIKGNFSLIR